MSRKGFKYRPPKPPAKQRVRRAAKPIRFGGEVGSAGHKTCVHYRCANKIRPGNDKRPGRKAPRSCDTRITLLMPVEWYENEGAVPKCPSCGARNWRRDRYRDLRERKHKRCRCDALPFPHKEGTYFLRADGTDFQMLCMARGQKWVESVMDRLWPVPF